MTTSRIRTYSELEKHRTFLDRYNYLAVHGEVGCATFGFDRWLNQQFYMSREWRLARRDVIARDGGCDLGIPGHEIYTKVIVHHMNPLVLDDIVHRTSNALDAEFLICVSHDTHNAIHFGDADRLPKKHIPRTPGDTKLW